MKAKPVRVQVEAAHAKVSAFSSSGFGGWPSVAAMLKEASGLQERQELFDLHVSQYLPLTRCQVWQLLLPRQPDQALCQAC